MKRRTWGTILFIICVIGFWIFENFYTPETYSPGEKTSQILPEKEFWPSHKGEIVMHQYFMLSYRDAYEQAEWVAYVLKPEQLTQDDRRRPYFIEDPKVSSKSADWRNYKGSGYDRGHLCPAGDRRFLEQAYNETFYTSNISPQDREFNAGVWNRLEQKTRYWCKKYGDLVVITGGILEKGLEEIGEEDVDVPKQFYKIMYRDGEEGEALIAFLMPNKESNRPLQDFAVSVSEIENLTGLNFFESKSTSWQDQFEKGTELNPWRF
ncbi:MAG: DNA/RNA non-specific endonuclease [Bacteroidota bacterium]